MNDIKALRRLVGENIRLRRKAKGWSQEDLAENAELSYKYIGEIERGTVNPSLDSLAKIAYALPTEITNLFDREQHRILTSQDMEKVKASLEVLNNVLNFGNIRK